MAAKPLSNAERIAEMFGLVVGAASLCDRVSEERLTTTAIKMKHVVLVAASDDAEAQAADQRFSVGLEAGRAAAEKGQIDPNKAEIALGEVEEQLTI